MRRLVIGDIHGCDDELRALLDKVALDRADEIIAVGDIIDRGPASPGVLAFFQTHTNASSIQGNHERKHIRSFRGEIPPALSQRITRERLGAAYPPAVAFMATFPLYLELPDAVLVHGFWEPGMSLTAQRESVIVGTLSGEKYLSERYQRPWYELYDGSKPLIVGHHDYLHTGQPMIYRDRVFAIDTGCCFGGALTGLVLPEFQFVSVRSRANYWQAIRSLHTKAVSAKPREIWKPSDEERLQWLYRYVVQEHVRVLRQLQLDPSFATLSAHEQGKRYAEQVRASLFAFYLHRAHRGELTLDLLRGHVGTPGPLRELLRHAGYEVEGG